MSIGPDRVVFPIDLMTGTFTTQITTPTGTGVTPGFPNGVELPPGNKVVSVTISATATMSVKIQNSLDKANWFDVSTSTSGQSVLYEVNSGVPFWRMNITAWTTALGTSWCTIAQRMSD
jgi:hypothetical protein